MIGGAGGLAGVRRLVERGEHVDLAARAVVDVAGLLEVDGLEVVPLVEARPALGQAERRMVVAVLDVDRRRLLRGMAARR